VGGDSCVFFFAQKFPGEIEKSETVRCFFVTNIRGDDFAHFYAVAVKQAELTVWPIGTNAL
jgi:hypothetical protein